MAISRRAFFARASAAAIGAMTLDPERLLWVPGQRAYFDIVSPPLFIDIGEYRFVHYASDADGWAAGLKRAGVVTLAGRWQSDAFSFVVTDK